MFVCYCVRKVISPPIASLSVISARHYDPLKPYNYPRPSSSRAKSTELKRQMKLPHDPLKVNPTDRLCPHTLRGPPETVRASLSLRSTAYLILPCPLSAEDTRSYSALKEASVSRNQSASGSALSLSLSHSLLTVSSLLFLSLLSHLLSHPLLSLPLLLAFSQLICLSSLFPSSLPYQLCPYVD